MPGIDPQRCHVLAQGPTVENVDELGAAANPEHGNANGFSLLKQ